MMPILFPRRQLEEIAKAKGASLSNPANFGLDFERHCICTSHDQVPCPGHKALPTSMRGKWQKKLRAGEITLEELQEMDRKT